MYRLYSNVLKDIFDVFLRGKSFWHCWLLQHEGSQARINCEFFRTLVQEGRKEGRKEDIRICNYMKGTPVPGRIAPVVTSLIIFSSFLEKIQHKNLSIGWQTTISGV